jgi:hypothetical protein
MCQLHEVTRERHARYDATGAASVLGLALERFVIVDADDPDDGVRLKAARPFLP